MIEILQDIQDTVNYKYYKCRLFPRYSTYIIFPRYSTHPPPHIMRVLPSLRNTFSHNIKVIFLDIFSPSPANCV